MADGVGQAPKEWKEQQSKERAECRNSVALVEEILDLQEQKVFKGFSGYDLRNIDEKQMASEIGNAIINLCEFADSVNHMLSENGLPTPEIQSAFAQIRQSVPAEILGKSDQAQ